MTKLNVAGRIKHRLPKPQRTAAQKPNNIARCAAIVVHEPGTGDVTEMRDQPPQLDTYPLLEGLLRAKGLSLKGMYSYRDAAAIFDCSVRALQERIRNGKLRKRNLPGRGKFLSVDLEDFLRNS
jgi:hypothetical protein